MADTEPSHRTHKPAQSTDNSGDMKESALSEIRVVVCGNVDAGKSTLLGVLTKGELDNGRGKARANVFRHKHEIETGRTSSVGTEILGFGNDDKCVNYHEEDFAAAAANASAGNVDDEAEGNQPKRMMLRSEICAKSSRVLLFLDLAGHERYLKTTVFGMTGNFPDACMLLVASNNGVIGMTKEHFHLCLALKLPVFVVVTKVDICPPNVLKDTVDTLTKMLKAPGSRKMPIFVRSHEDLRTVVTNFGGSDRVCPVFLVSNVTGQGLELVREFLKHLKSKDQWRLAVNDPAEYHIDETYSITGVGTVVAGTLVSGRVSVNDQLLLGPDSIGQFSAAVVKSIHTNCMPVQTVHAGQSCSFALKKWRRKDIRKGMVIVSPLMAPKSHWEFEAEVLVITHATTIGVGYQSVVHCGVCRQAAQIIHMATDVLRSGCRSNVRFRFMYRPEYLKENAMLIFREGKTKGIGKVTKLIAAEEEIGQNMVRVKRKKRAT